MDGATFDSTTFRTPPRILIPKLVASRDGWKRKAGERKRRLKAAQVRHRDLTASRARWQERARAAETQAYELRRQLERTQQECAAAEAAAEHGRDAVKKKSPPLR